MSITVYTFEGETYDDYSTQDPEEARERGQRYGMKVIANEYEFSDSEVAWDFSPTPDEDED